MASVLYFGHHTLGQKLEEQSARWSDELARVEEDIKANSDVALAPVDKGPKNEES